jgi:hypothetical protein
LKESPKPEEEQLNPGHLQVRNVLRIAGPIMLGLGVILMIVGFVDFAIAMSSFGHFPKLFWCFMVGMPLVFFGGVATKTAYMGAMARYVSAESSPVAKDTFNYMAKGTKEGVREIAGAIREGLVGEDSSGVRCGSCDQLNDRDASFCDACGSKMSCEKDCPACEAPNDAQAKFCDHCGTSLASVC